MILALLLVILLAGLSRTDMNINILLITSWQIFSALSDELCSLSTYLFTMIGVYVISSLKFEIDSSLDLTWKCFYPFTTLLFTFIQFMQRYVIEKAHRDIFLSENTIKCELKKINDILSILVPSFVKDLFLRGYKFFVLFICYHKFIKEFIHCQRNNPM